MSSLPAFRDFFRALWGDSREPFPWQAMLAERVSKQRWPDVIDLPTAAGKTASLDIAVYALAAQAEASIGERTAPRRIWFVVDRRIVVDEAFERAQKLAEKLNDASAPSAIRSVAERLLAVRGLPSAQRPLATARLRGGILRDDGWARIPSQPAIITSTVDQFGSRLLFRTYGSSSLAAPIYAGLAGNDSLILLDEAHCAAPFLQTLRAVQLFRHSKWSEVENRMPFQTVVMSATPPSESNEEPLDVFPDETEREQALANDELQLRLQVSKKAVLNTSKIRDEEALSEELAKAAIKFFRGGKRRIAVIVNRVAHANRITELLRSEAKKTPPDTSPAFEVELLTGRIRPFERDLLIGNGTSLHRVLRSFAPEEPMRPVIVVATQCLEVGADFSFDALATECASVDALRQRFGRLDRLGTHGQSPAVILVAKSQLKQKEPDPIYGEAIKNTWEFLRSIGTPENAGGTDETQTVDFGVNAIAALLPAGDELEQLLAPAPDAPVLLPAHLDLFCQTAPQPHPTPEIDPFLHGKGRGLPEVRIVWRCDLAEVPSERWLEIVSLCRPITSEMLSVPLYRFKQWLRDRLGVDPTGDVQGGTYQPNEERHREALTHEFLIWRGRKRSEILTDPDEIPPGSVLVLPVPSSDEADALGQTLRCQGFGRDRLDLWELAWKATNRPAMLRVNRACLGEWIGICPPLAELLDLAEYDDWDIDELRDSFTSVQDWISSGENKSEFPDWFRNLFAKDFRFHNVDQHPAGGLILQAAANLNQEDEPDFFADDEEETSEAPNFVRLEQHTADVKQNATALARVCLGDSSVHLYEIAGQWHDVGKLDLRFQTLLWGGIPGLTGPLAKSPSLPRSRERTDSLRLIANLPNDFRHEMLSLQLAERSTVNDLSPIDRELFLHLVASHHGYARPFAPVCEDSEAVNLDATLDCISISLSAEERRSLIPPHRLDSGVSDRFWALTRRFGWWGIAYREAILRLADWYASAKPRSVGDAE